ncbi:MAG TPA: hypothetical protein VH599_01840 [Ktedonobacterales bacterium]
MDLLLQKLQQFFRERSIECYLVGGSLRDLLLGQQPQDLDLAVRGNPEPVARALADELKGRYIALGLEKGVKRVILHKKPYSRFIIDIAPLHGEQIADDLSQRDFTINALALSLEEAAALTTLPTQQQKPAPLIDPFNGWRDLHASTLRAVQPGVFQHDPLRLLRAIRLSARRQLSIEPSTASLLHRDAPLLIRVTPARIRDELLQMTSLPNVAEAIRMLAAYQLFPAIFPAFYDSGNQVDCSKNWSPDRSAWSTLTCMAKLISASQGEAASLTQIEQQILAPLLRLSNRPAFKKRWKKSPGGAHPRSVLHLQAALLSALLQAGGTPTSHLEGNTASPHPPEQLRLIAAALKRLTMGRRATAFIVFLLQEGLSPWKVEPRPQAGSSEPWIAARHYFERFGERGVDLACFCLALQMSAPQQEPPDGGWLAQVQILTDLIEAYHYERDSIIPPSLIDGQTIITRLDFMKGAAIGALLAQARKAQLDGIIQTRAEALQFIADHASSSRGSVQQEVSGIGQNKNSALKQSSE